MDNTTIALPKTADEELADKIADSLGAAKLISTEKLPRVRDGLRKGNLTSADWKLLVELSEPTKSGGTAE
ncbi:hypothetical protein [Terriglobus aquaticus]|uniref:Uncharacterized protein n=1 Tax=Terriglobus aquaticus TaxID=940139 RepID=A0ABW9KL62_9BACT|nr:hypothetical protein [Terriglobus aquaticus]